MNALVVGAVLVKLSVAFIFDLEHLPLIPNDQNPPPIRHPHGQWLFSWAAQSPDWS